MIKAPFDCWAVYDYQAIDGKHHLLSLIRIEHHNGNSLKELIKAGLELNGHRAARAFTYSTGDHISLTLPEE